MVTSVNSELAGHYRGFMAEIKDRLVSASRVFDPGVGQPFFQRDYLAAEYVLIQLRMCIEALALACAVAHDGIIDIRSKSFRKDFSATSIFKKIHSENPDFFPKAVIAKGVWPNMSLEDNHSVNLSMQEVSERV